MNRHKLYISALEDAGVKTVYGRFKLVDKYCLLCKKNYKTHEEKKTDVNIAVKLFKEAMNGSFDTAIVISGDSDLMPSIEAAKSSFPNKEFGIVIPINRPAEDLKSAAHFHMKMKEKHLSSSQFSDILVLQDGKKIFRPSHWK